MRSLKHLHWMREDIAYSEMPTGTGKLSTLFNYILSGTLRSMYRVTIYRRLG
jgi:hypothetical protein